MEWALIEMLNKCFSFLFSNLYKVRDSDNWHMMYCEQRRQNLIDHDTDHYRQNRLLMHL